MKTSKNIITILTSENMLKVPKGAIIYKLDSLTLKHILEQNGFKFNTTRYNLWHKIEKSGVSSVQEGLQSGMNFPYLVKKKFKIKGLSDKTIEQVIDRVDVNERNQLLNVKRIEISEEEKLKKKLAGDLLLPDIYWEFKMFSFKESKIYTGKDSHFSSQRFKLMNVPIPLGIYYKLALRRFAFSFYVSF